jgi:hypothetical protein
MCSEVALSVVSAGGRPGLTHFPAFDTKESCEHKHGEGERSEQQELRAADDFGRGSRSQYGAV